MAGYSTGMFLLICASIFLGITAQENDCPPTWKRFNNSCYFLNHDARVPWAQAVIECKDRGADLTSIHSLEEQRFLADCILPFDQFNHYAIGFHDMDTEREFKWTDGTEVDYTAWNPGEPNNVGKFGENCVGLRIQRSGNWNDFNCNGNNRYICKTKPALNVWTCEHATLHITCDDGYIQIRYANYGRLDRSTCGWDSRWNDNCAADQSLTIVAEMCNGKNTCEIKASNDIFDDPCSITQKYLEVRYSCEKEIESTPTTTKEILVVTSAETTTEEPDIMPSESTTVTLAKNTSAVTTTNRSMMMPLKSSSLTSTVVVPAVLTVIGLIIFAVCVFIALFVRRRRKNKERSSTTTELELNGSRGYNNGVIPPASPDGISSRAPEKSGKNDTQNDNIYNDITENERQYTYANVNTGNLPNDTRNNDATELIEIYANSEYGRGENNDDSNRSDSHDYAYACTDQITDQAIDDDYAYATSNSLTNKERDNQIESNNENEGWKDNEIYATESTVQTNEDNEGWADNSIYVDSDHVFEVNGQNEGEVEGWEDNSVYATK